MKALNAITERLRAIADEIDAGHPVDAFAIRIEATRIAAQAEMIERGLLEVGE